MARFMVRIELSGANSEDYENLHEKMKLKGYSREIQGDDGTWFYLPTAEYTAIKTSTAPNVRDEVRNIASSVKTDYQVFVSEAANTSWYLNKK